MGRTRSFLFPGYSFEDLCNDLGKVGYPEARTNPRNMSASFVLQKGQKAPFKALSFTSRRARENGGLEPVPFQGSQGQGGDPVILPAGGGQGSTTAPL